MAQKVASLYAELKVQDNLTPGLKKAERGLDQFGEKTKTGIGNLKGMGIAAGAVTAALVVGTATMIKFANEGIKIEKSAMAFEKLAGGAQNAQQWIDAITAASRGSVTQFEATNQAIQLMTMGLANSAAEAGRFMEIAAITAAINPELGSIENAITNIGLTLANDSWMRLDQLGVDATKAKARIEELKQEGMAMTEAFDVAVMEQLEENAQKIGTDVLEIGKNTAQMQTAWREAKDSASEFALVVSEKVAPGLADALGIITQMVDGMTELAQGDFSSLTNEDQLVQALNQDLQLFNPGGFGTPRWFAGSSQDPAANLGGWTPYAPANSSIVPANGGGKGSAPTLSSRDIPLNELISMALPLLPRNDIVTSTGMPAFVPPPITRTDPGSVMGGGVGADQASAQMASALWGGNNSGLRGLTGDHVSNLVEAAGQMQRIEDASIAFADNMDRAVQSAADAQFESLAEKFGTDQAGRFDTDVFNAMQNALRGIEMEGTAAGDAMLYYQLQTGIATGSSEIFSGQMDTLAQELADGAISAEEYVNNVMGLAQADFSQVDQIVQGFIDEGDLALAQEYINAVSQLSSFTGVTGGMTQEEANPWLAGVGLGGDTGEEDAGPLQAVIDDLTTIEESAGASFDPALEDIDMMSERLGTIAATNYQAAITVSIEPAPGTAAVLYDMIVAEDMRRGGRGSAPVQPSSSPSGRGAIP